MAAWFPAEMRMIELEIFWEETAETMPREASKKKAIARTWSHTVGVLAALLLDVLGGRQPRHSPRSANRFEIDAAPCLSDTAGLTEDASA